MKQSKEKICSCGLGNWLSSLEVVENDLWPVEVEGGSQVNELDVRHEDLHVDRLDVLDLLGAGLCGADQAAP